MEKGPARRWVKAYTTFDESEAVILQGLLRNEGISCRVESMRLSQLPVNVGDLGEYQLFVHAEDFDKARKIMDSTRTEEGD